MKQGQALVELDAAELRARREAAAAQLAEMEAGPRKEEIEAGKNDWEALKAEAMQADADARRAQQLLAEKTISPTEEQQALTPASTLDKQVAASKSRYDLRLVYADGRAVLKRGFNLCRRTRTQPATLTARFNVA